MTVEDELLNVREAAQRLVVHENTVRNWAREGELPDARLPGSRYLRFRASDVDRLIKQRGARTPSLQSERQAVNPEFVTANQLKQWPTNWQRDAQENFPQLIRRLLVETPGITNISVRSGDGIGLSEYDGLADSTSTPFLPAGELAFEFSVEKDVKGKATRAYNDRVSGAPSPKIFVFATPRHFAGKFAWAEERKAEGHFADVKVLDADDLEGWLHAAPCALYWISEHLGLRPREAVSLDTWWERFSGSTDPRLPTGLFLAGRHTQAIQLVERLTTASTLTVVQSEWTDDCLAFVHATLAEQAQDTLAFGTVLVVLTVTAWDSILEKQVRAVLIPQFEDADVGRAIDKGHHVVTVIDRPAASRQPADLELPRPDRREAAEALRAAGVEFPEADQLAALGRRSMPALRRRLSLNPKITQPDWAHNPDAHILALLVLVGAWTSESDDIAALEMVTDETWKVIQPLLIRLSTSSDPLIRKVGGSWYFASPEEAFLLLNGSLTTEARQRLTEVAVSVLCAPDPVLDLAPGERWRAGLLGVRRCYSSVLRNGLAQGLALMGAIESDVVLDDSSVLSDVAEDTVQRLLEDANADVSGRLWHQLAEVLPLLAEAAPNVFIHAVEEDLDRSKPALLRLFQEEHQIGQIFGPSSPHPHLLWALETICWSSEHLIDGARILARLASIEPGGKSGNRPISSLTSILRGQDRHTSGSLDARLQAVDAAYRVDEKVGWKTTFGLWPRAQGCVMPPAAPRFRYWRPTETDVPMSEWIAFTHSLVDRAIDHAGTDADRLGQLIEGIATVPSDDQERIIATIVDRTSDGVLDNESRLVLWDRLHALVSRHGQFANATWALPADTRNRLSTLAAAIKPNTDPQRFAYLFDWHPDLPGHDQRDFELYDAELRRMRSEALQSVLRSPHGIEELSQLARRAKSPAQLGWALAEHDEVDLPQLLSWFSSDEPALREAAANWTRRRSMLCGPQWFVKALREPGLQAAARDLLIHNAPATRDTWQALNASLVREDAQTYWTKATFNSVELSDAAEALEQLIVHGRAWTAIAVASHAIDQVERSKTQGGTSITPELIARILDAAVEQAPLDSMPSNMTMTGFYIGKLLDYLGKFAHFEATIARCEFSFFQLLENMREPTVLNRSLATRPEIYVDIVKRVYRGRSEPRRELTQAEQGRAAQAWWVLDGWKGFPGQGDDGLLHVGIMNDWVKAARLALSEADRSDIGDEMIGQSFAHSPPGEDGAWPAEPVRDLLETIGSRELEHGMVLGKMNSRGITWRDIYEGGQQEKNLAKQCREWSQMTRPRWPRTARILRELADSYDREARRQDNEAELDADRG